MQPANAELRVHRETGDGASPLRRRLACQKLPVTQATIGVVSRCIRSQVAVRRRLHHSRASHRGARQTRPCAVHRARPRLRWPRRRRLGEAAQVGVDQAALVRRRRAYGADQGIQPDQREDWPVFGCRRAARAPFVRRDAVQLRQCEARRCGGTVEPGEGAVARWGVQHELNCESGARGHRHAAASGRLGHHRAASGNPEFTGVVQPRNCGQHVRMRLCTSAHDADEGWREGVKGV